MRKFPVPVKATEQIGETILIQYLIALLVSQPPSLVSLCQASPPATVVLKGSASYEALGSFQSHVLAPKPCSSCKSSKPLGFWDVPLTRESSDVATFSAYRRSRFGRQRQDETPPQTGQKPPGRRGRWGGSSAKRLKHPIFSGAPVPP